jgi:hypothetical protein
MFRSIIYYIYASYYKCMIKLYIFKCRRIQIKKQKLLSENEALRNEIGKF